MTLLTSDPPDPIMSASLSPGSSAKQAVRKQQLRTWKLQRKEEETRWQEEEERRKREEEIRQIRDLSNQDEQYNRFMKLVGGKRTRSRVRTSAARRELSSGECDVIVWSPISCLCSVQGSRPQEVCREAGPGLLREPLPVWQLWRGRHGYGQWDQLTRWVGYTQLTRTSCLRLNDTFPVSVPSPMHNLLPADEAACFPPLGFYGAEAGAYGMVRSKHQALFTSSLLNGTLPTTLII